LLIRPPSGSKLKTKHFDFNPTASHDAGGGRLDDYQITHR